MEEVLQDSSWLDKKWAEKDRLLNHFARHQSFPSDTRGFRRPRIFETRFHSLENSLVSMGRLLILPCTVPVLVLLSIPIFWTLLWIWLAFKLFRLFFPEPNAESSRDGENFAGSAAGAGQTPSATTPYCPTTPFVSPSITAWLPGQQSSTQ